MSEKELCSNCMEPSDRRRWTSSSSSIVYHRIRCANLHARTHNSLSPPCHIVPSSRIRPLATAVAAPLHPALSLASRLMLLMVAPLEYPLSLSYTHHVRTHIQTKHEQIRSTIISHDMLSCMVDRYCSTLAAILMICG